MHLRCISTCTAAMDVAPGHAAGVGGRYPSVKYPNAPDVENGAGGRGPPYGSDARAYPPDQMCGKASGIELHSKMGPGQHATHTGAPDGSGRIDAAPMASAGTSFFTASNSHSYMGSDTSSSMYGSQVPLMGCRADAASSKDAKAYIGGWAQPNCHTWPDSPACYASVGCQPSTTAAMCCVAARHSCCTPPSQQLLVIPCQC